MNATYGNYERLARETAYAVARDAAYLLAQARDAHRVACESGDELAIANATYAYSDAFNIAREARDAYNAAAQREREARDA